MLTRAHHQRIIRACIYLPTLSAQKLEISESESVEANMEAEAGLTLGVLAVVAKTPSVFGTHMGSAMSMMEALGSKELGGVMDFLFSMSLYNRHREIKSVFAFYVHITGVGFGIIDALFPPREVAGSGVVGIVLCCMCVCACVKEISI
jgi:hypothetical protein